MYVNNNIHTGYRVHDNTGEIYYFVIIIYYLYIIRVLYNVLQYRSTCSSVEALPVVAS